MGDTKELKKIKRIYGEKFKNLCRELFPVIIEQEGRLLEILEKRFSHNCDSLYEVITENGLVENFKELVFSEFDLTREEEKKEEEKRTPYKILEEEGYDLIECKSEEDIQGFRKYYAPSEVLCTIYNGGRLATRDCFFAVRKDVDKIRREDFKNPDKSDEYSTSVLGIQFTRDKRSTVQIISRYNHTVSNPNCTLGNDLDKLAPGLSQSFANLLKERGLNLTTENKEEFEMPGYTLARDGRYYKYNMEINGEYFCPGNIVISDGVARSIGELERGVLIDHFYIDFQNKTIKDMRYNADFHKDTFVDAFEHIEKIEVERTEGTNKRIKVYIPNQEKPIEIEVDRDNQIIGYINHDVRRIGDNFLFYNKGLREIEIPNLEEVGNYFLYENKGLEEINVPSLRIVGNKFLYYNRRLREIEIPNLEVVGHDFLYENRGLEKINAPSLQSVEHGFLGLNEILEEIEIPKLEVARLGFLFSNRGLKKINAPSLRGVEGYFLYQNEGLKEIEIPNLEVVGNYFLYENRGLEKINAPSLRSVRDGFLYKNERLKEIEIPNLERVGNNFLFHNKTLKKINAPSLQRVGDDFFSEDAMLIDISIPNIRYLEEELRERGEMNIKAAGEEKRLISKIYAQREKIKEQEEEIGELKSERDSRDSKESLQH